MRLLSSLRRAWRGVAVLTAAVVLVPSAPASARTDPDASAPGRAVADLVNRLHCIANTAPQLILVNISAQHAWFCTGTTLLADSAVTTGRLTDGHQTHPGTWHIQAKQPDRTLVGPGYADFVHYWMPYDGDFGIHDATWQTFPFGGAQWTQHGSAGCVHMPLNVMAWLYNWAQPGATVTITS